jgi:predicted ATPase/DNA-binding SARP family transcriptional activator
MAPATTGPDPRVMFCVLGPLVVRRDGRPVRLGGHRQRALLAYFAVHAGELLAAERILDEVWPEGGEASLGVLRTYVWQIRKLLGGPAGSVLRTDGGTYQLDVGDDQLDLAAFEQRLSHAQAVLADGGGATAAIAHVEEALSLWRGPALDGLRHERALQRVAERLDRLHVDAAELHAEILLRLGRHHEVIGDLERLVGEQPVRENLWCLLLGAYQRAGRHGDAAAAYERAQEVLADRGIEPGRQLRLAHEQPSGPVPIGPDPLSLPVAPARRSVANLDPPQTAFVGREAELGSALGLLRARRLVTLHGSGGSGKTRLAIELAQRVAADGGSEVVFVDLTAATVDEDVIRSLAGALQLPGGQARDLADVAGSLRARPVLLVLDNCEQVIQGVGDTVEALLRRCPGVRVLATSREELALDGESIVPVTGLPVTSGSGERGVAAAVELFYAVAARRGETGLAGGPADRDLVIEICRRLDGLPLAIELAADLLSSLPLTEIAARLDRRLDLPVRGNRLAPPRHHTLSATIAWSYDLLDPDEQGIFRAVSLFIGDFPLAAAEAVAGVDRADTPALVTSLVSKSLLVSVPDAGESRFRMLGTIRQYGLSLLVERPEERMILRRRHARHYAVVSEQTQPRLRGPEAAVGLADIGAELPNVREALAWSASEEGDLETAIGIARGFRYSFCRLGRFGEAQTWLDQALLRRDELSPRALLSLMNASLTVALSRGSYNRARELGEEAIALARAVGDRRELAIALTLRANGALYESDDGPTRACVAEGLPLAREIGDRSSEAWLLNAAGAVARKAGDAEAARRRLSEAIRILRARGEMLDEVLPRVNLALVAQDGGDLGEAASQLDRALALAERMADGHYVHVCRGALGRVEVRRNNVAAACELLVACVTEHGRDHHLLVVARAIEGMALLIGRTGRSREAVVLLAYTRRLRRDWGMGQTAPSRGGGGAGASSTPAMRPPPPISRPKRWSAPGRRARACRSSRRRLGRSKVSPISAGCRPPRSRVRAANRWR